MGKCPIFLIFAVLITWGYSVPLMILGRDRRWYRRPISNLARSALPSSITSLHRVPRFGGALSIGSLAHALSRGPVLNMSRRDRQMTEPNVSRREAVCFAWCQLGQISAWPARTGRRTSIYRRQVQSARAKFRTFRLLRVPDRMRAPMWPVTQAAAADVRN